VVVGDWILDSEHREALPEAPKSKKSKNSPDLQGNSQKKKLR
jgi:hypothetical protein